MRKFLKKIKLKHLARVGLVMMLTCYLMMFLCSATKTINVSFTNPNKLTTDYDSIKVVYYTLDEEVKSDVELGKNSSISFSEFYTTQSVFAVLDGDFGAYVDGEFEVLFEDVGVEEGYYNVIIIQGYNYSDGTTFVCPQIEDVDFDYSEVGNGILINLFTLDSFPTEINVELVDITKGYDSENGYLFVNNFILVPSSPPPPPEQKITEVWTSILGWVTGSITSAVGIFWNGTSLTLIGTLALVGTSIAICLLIFNKVKDFLHLQ